MRCFAVLLGAITAVVVTAAPVPAPKAPPPITAVNAKDLHPLRELPVAAWQAVWGPQRGEVTLLPWEQPARVFDATTGKEVREVGATKKLIHLAFAPGGELPASERKVVLWGIREK